MVCLPFSLLLITEVDFIRKVDIGEKKEIDENRFNALVSENGFQYQ